MTDGWFDEVRLKPCPKCGGTLMSVLVPSRGRAAQCDEVAWCYVCGEVFELSEVTDGPEVCEEA